MKALAASGGGGSTKSLLERLHAALRSDGDFPVRAKVVTELRSLANNPNSTIGQISEVILREPSLGTRILHLVNSAYYRRSVPIITVTQAVIQVGMRTISEMCAGMVLMHKFLPIAKRGGVFAESIKRSIVTSLLTSSIAAELKEPGASERGYLAGTLYNIGTLLLGYYFPQVYENAAKRAVTLGRDTSQSIAELLGVSLIDINVLVIEALEIPSYYKNILEEAARPLEERGEVGPDTPLANALTTAAALAETIAADQGPESICRCIDSLSNQFGFSVDSLYQLIQSLPRVFADHCSLIELNMLSLPSYLSTIDPQSKYP